MLDANHILSRCDALAALTETPGTVTRTYLTPCHRQANALVEQWMCQAGLRVRMDAVGNIIGRRDGVQAGAPVVMLGSHLDTVRDAGRYDGILGVVLAIAVIEALGDTPLPFAIEVVGFGEEEGVRFGATLIGSRAIAGTFDPAWLSLRDQSGTSLAEAMTAFGLDPARVEQAALTPPPLAYLEVHIEHGPVLEAKDLPVGVVSAICGAVRRRFHVTGMAGHAGTVPMRGRRDALAGAAEMVLAVERVGRAHAVVATVGRLTVAPDAVNVIPGAVTFTLDLRAEDDHERDAALADIETALADIAAARALTLDGETFYRAASVPCDPGLRAVLTQAVAEYAIPPLALPSGAGHDAMAIAAIAPVAMLFVRCGGGISHHPAESVHADDVGVAARVLLSTLHRLAQGITTP